MILLPSPPRRASLRSFWLVLCAIVLALIGMLARTKTDIAILGLPMLLIAFFTGMFWPRIIDRPYRMWNRIARLYRGVAERLLLRLSYWAIIVPAGWIGTSLKLRRPSPGESLWESRQSLRPVLYQQLHSYPETTGAHNWITRYIIWARSSRQLWTLALLPFLCLLFWLKEEEDSVVREGIYTLF